MIKYTPTTPAYFGRTKEFGDNRNPIIRKILGHGIHKDVVVLCLGVIKENDFHKDPRLSYKSGRNCLTASQMKRTPPRYRHCSLCSFFCLLSFIFFYLDFPLFT